MNVTKYLHSCLLIEDQNKTILMDPGIFTYNEKVLNIESLSSLDYILITHEHFDHLHVPFIKELVTKFPQVKIITTKSAVSILEKEDISADSLGNDHISLLEAPHEELWDTEVPENALIHVLDKLSHPGDSLHLAKSKDILALPITAPWGSTTASVEKALALHPKVIIPVHDYMWKDEIRKTMYQRLRDFFAKNDIDFRPMETGEIVKF